MYAQFKFCSWCDHEYWADKPTRKYCSHACRSAKAWSAYENEVDSWYAEYEAGDSYKVIAERHGRAYNTVRKCLQYHGHKPRANYAVGLQHLQRIDA